MDDCVFCKIVNGEISANLIWENDNFISFPDVNPKTEGHSIVIPKQHFKTTLDLPASLGHELMDCIKNTAVKVLDETKTGGFNVLSNNFPVAGQVVHHVHYHVIPRKEGDGIHFLK